MTRTTENLGGIRARHLTSRNASCNPNSHQAIELRTTPSTQPPGFVCPWEGSSDSSSSLCGDLRTVRGRRRHWTGHRTVHPA